MEKNLNKGGVYKLTSDDLSLFFERIRTFSECCNVPGTGIGHVRPSLAKGF